MHAPRSLGAYGLTVLITMFGGCGVIQKCAPPSVSAPIDISSECTDMVNVERSNAGLASVAVVDVLNQVAEGHSTDQAKNQAMSHAESNGSNAGDRITAQGFVWSTWAENVAAGQGDCASVIGAWMGSDGHRANILNPAMTSVGIGAVTGTNGVIYWTMDLAAAG
ncbi:MAG TPA: CAP domain-containing protein [Ilumatobacteraceae bacterium]|nr:CAP domain-containing protein [Ilumatobacteraceae bacterium]HRB04318.1 CAP domain-containing protein [Ilumatobacteraceae bacterium]